MSKEIKSEVKRTAPKKQNMFLETIKRLLKSNVAVTGLIILLIVILLAIFAPMLAPYDYNTIDLMNANQGPSGEHWFGTDGYGRDILSRLMYGGRYSLVIGLFGAVLSTILGVIIGMIAGFFGGTADTVVMRIMDILQSIPGMLLCIILSTILGPGVFNTILALSIGGITPAVRITRGQLLGERSKEYIEAATSINCSKMSIMFGEILPNTMSPLIVHTTMAVGGTIMQASTLSYLGMGVQPPTPEWGAMLSEGKNLLRTAPHVAVFPGIVIAVVILAVNLFGDGLRDALDPKMKH